MAEIPSYGAPKVTPGAGPGIRVPTASPVASIGEAFDPAVNMGRKILEEEKRNVDAADLTAADNELARIQSSLQQTIAQLQGKDVLAARQLLKAEWDKSVPEVANSVGSNAVKAQLGASAAKRKADLERITEIHIADQLDKYDTKETDSAIKNAKNLAVMGWKDGKIVLDQAEEISKTMKSWAARKGIPEDSAQFKEGFKTERSALFTGVIQSALQAGQEEVARAYFGHAQSEEQLTAADFERIEGAFQAHKEKAKETNFLSALNMIEQNPRVNPKTLIPRLQWESLSKNQREDLLQYQGKISQGIPQVSDEETEYELSRLNQRQLAAVNLLDYRTSLTQERFNHWLGQQQTARKGDEAAVEKLKGTQTRTQIVSGLLKSAGINPNAKKGTDDSRRGAAVQSLVDQRIKEFYEKTGKNPDSTEITKMAKEILKEKITQRDFLWDKKTSAADVLDQMAEIPDSDQELIIDSLKKRGKEVTPANIVDLYQKYKAKHGK